MPLTTICLYIALAALAFYAWVMDKRLEKLEKLYKRSIPMLDWYENDVRSYLDELDAAIESKDAAEKA